MLTIQKFAKGLSPFLIRRTSSSVTTAAKVTFDHHDNLPKKSKSKSLVASVFENTTANETTTGKSEIASISGNQEKNNEIKSKPNDLIDERILNAKTVNGLLSITETNTSLSRKHALKVVSILSEWSNVNRVKLSDFENDSRFLKICRVLGRTGASNNNVHGITNNQKKNKIEGFRTDDLNTVLGVAGDDEAAKLIASISLPQMVKVMSALAQRKRRSTPLLRSLAFNISSNSQLLNLKQSADILYAMALLNFSDSVLTAKVCSDIQVTLPKNEEKSAVVGSILTSLGILKYKDLDVLESLCKWMLSNHEICRYQDISSLFITLAILGFESTIMSEVKEKLSKTIVQQDFIKPQDWLSHVWALSLLKFSNGEQIQTVLSKEFIKQLEVKNEISPNIKMKLLNINAYAKLLMSNYTGPLLPEDSSIFSVPLARSKSKQILSNSMMDSLKSLLSSPDFAKTSVDSKMGFLIDCVCIFDEKGNPLPVHENHLNAKKIAIMLIDYHDMCHGTHKSISGLTKFSFELLEKLEYNILDVLHTEFSTSDKLLKRVQYLESKIKTIVNKKN